MTSPASPAFETFLRELLGVARLTEVLRGTPDDRAELALRQHLAALDHALRQLPAAEHLEACSLLAGLRERLQDSAIDELTPCRAFLGRFAW